MNETWLLPETLNAHVDIPDFELFRCDNGRGGGVCIYVRNQLIVNVINFPSPKQPGIKDVWVSVQSNMFTAVIVGCVYRHTKAPATSFEYSKDVVVHFCVTKKLLYVLGDFNDLICKGNKLSGIIKNNKLTQMLDDPTRVTSTSATSLYLIDQNMRTDDVNQQISIFNNSFIKCLDKCAPYVTKEITKPYPPWLNDDLRQAKRKRDEARNNLKRDRINPLCYISTLIRRKKVNSCITATKKEYYSQNLQGCKDDTSATRNIIKKIAPNQKKNPQVHMTLKIL